MECACCINLLKDICRGNIIDNKGPHNETEYTAFPYHRIQDYNPGKVKTN